MQRLMAALLWLGLATPGLAEAKELVRIAVIGPDLVDNAHTSATGDLAAWRELHYEAVDRPEAQLSSREWILSYTFDAHVGHGGQTIAVNEYRYFPLDSGAPGYLYYANVRGGWSSAVGMWFRLDQESDAILRSILKRMQVSAAQ